MREQLWDELRIDKSKVDALCQEITALEQARGTPALRQQATQTHTSAAKTEAPATTAKVSLNLSRSRPAENASVNVFDTKALTPPAHAADPSNKYKRARDEKKEPQEPPSKRRSRSRSRSHNRADEQGRRGGTRKRDRSHHEHHHHHHSHDQRHHKEDDDRHSRERGKHHKDTQQHHHHKDSKHKT